MGYTNEIELKRIFYDALSIGPMYEPLIDDLKEKNLFDKAGDLLCQDVIKCLYSNSYLK